MANIKFDTLSQEQKLKDCMADKIRYEHQMNILINDRSKDWYTDLGEYFYNITKGKLPEEISENFKCLIYGYIQPRKRGIYSEYSFGAIQFITAILDDESLRKMFGEPLYHSKFGEGFKGEYNEDTDEYDEPEIKEQYASYFVNVNGVECHIGYDDRGTSIEVQSGISPQKCFDTIKSLMDLYKEKCCN